jgi:hypothetical protein
MRISEISFWNNEPTAENRSDLQPDSPDAPLDDDLTNLANAFTRRGAVKHFWPDQKVSSLDQRRPMLNLT